MEVSSRTSDRGESTPSGGGDGGAHIDTVVELLLAVGYVDGNFHPREQAYVRRYIEALLIQIEQSAPDGGGPTLRAAWQQHFHALYEKLDRDIAKLADGTAVMEDGVVTTPLTKRAVKLFESLSITDQSTALELIHALIHADGKIAPEEHSLYERLTSLMASSPPASATEDTAQMQRLNRTDATTVTPLIVGAPAFPELVALSHPLLDPLEQTYSPHPVERKSQIDWDYQLVQRVIAQWHHQRTFGVGRLRGLQTPDQIPVGSRFLDGYVYAMRPSQPVELVVLGDLHGCYSCLKAAMLQSNFVQRVWAHQWDPERFPDVKLVLLGDYIDRGLFSFDGVLRSVLQLFLSMPDHVFVLRGNHEYLMRHENEVFSCVHPAEAIASIAPHVPIEMLDAYRILFEHMPTSLICDTTYFVHGGIPRDDTFEERYQDLSSLNDPDLRFQMMWSDPVATDHIPVDMQRHNPRFSFGRKQFQAFMRRTGFSTIIRGHEQIETGFQVFYNLGEHLLLNLFSAGGHDNSDLPPSSSYRNITPMALTVQFGRGTPTATPWFLHYKPFNYPPHNGLYRPHPVLEFRHM